jgi:hypothetical protein
MKESEPMKISKNTIDILKHFASINQNIMIKKGSALTTRTVAKNLFASAVVDTDFPQDFGIYNLGQFLGVLSLFSDPEVALSDKSMTISQGKNKVQYLFAAPEVLDFPEKVINMPKIEAQFELTEENLKSLLKAGAVLSSTDLCISGDGSIITCTTLDPKNPSANTFSVEVGETTRTFKAFIKLETLKLPSGPYNVGLSSKKIAKFENTDINYEVFIANTGDSTWVAE